MENLPNDMKIARRGFLKKAAYIAPAVVALGSLTEASAKAGGNGNGNNGNGNGNSGSTGNGNGKGNGGGQTSSKLIG